MGKVSKLPPGCPKWIDRDLDGNGVKTQPYGANLTKVWRLPPGCPKWVDGDLGGKEPKHCKM